MLLIQPQKRSDDEILNIQSILMNMRTFKNYNNDIRNSLAEDIIYQFFPAGRTIIRQDHKPHGQYYIIKGQLQILKTVYDNFTGNVTVCEE
jgi:CRP-like cAMP-binding protein